MPVLRNYPACLAFNSNANHPNDEVEVADAVEVRSRDEFSLELWLKMHHLRTAASQFQQVVTKQDDANNGYQVFLPSLGGTATSKCIFFNVHRGGAVSEVPIWCPIDRWAHFVMNYLAGTGLTIYMNGKLATIGTGLYNQALPAFTTNLLFGDQRPGALQNSPYHGLLSNVVLRSRRLTPTEVYELYRYDIEPGDRLAGWQISEGVGTTVADSEGANDGTVTEPRWTPESPP